MKDSCGILGIVKRGALRHNFAVHKGKGTVDQVISKNALRKLGELGPQLTLGLKELQHRGQESAGIVVNNNCGIGHNRYSTAGNGDAFNIQPIVGNFRGEPFALAHNGNLINAEEIRELLKRRGLLIAYEFSDTWLIVALIETSPELIFLSALKEVLPLIKGAFSLIILWQDKIIGVRDSLGIRPLCIGESDEYFVLASESCALGSLGANLTRDIRPGEWVILDRTGMNSSEWAASAKLKICIFEYIYFARPDSVIEGVSVYKARKNLGRYAFCQHKQMLSDAELIVPIKDSGTLGAIGAEEQSGLRLDTEVLCRPHFTYLRPRTFIEGEQKSREEKVWLKFRPILFDIQDKNIILVDDSIVRATTAPRVIKLLKTPSKILGKNINAADKIYVLVTSPPYMNPCYYGIDTWRYYEKGELCARNFGGDIERLRQHIGADYLGYLSLENTKRAILEADLIGNLKSDNFCAACFTGDYPISIK